MNLAGMMTMTTLYEQLEAAHSWSVLTKLPVPVYVEPYDAHLVYWNGVATTRTYAMLIIMTTWSNMYHTYSVKESAWKEFNRIYRLGAFGHYDWNDRIAGNNHHSMPSYIKNLIDKGDSFIEGLRNGYSPSEALGWLTPDNSKILSGELHEI